MVSGLAQSFLETPIFFCKLFFPLVKINKTLNVPPFSLYDFFPLGVSFLKCFPLVVDFITHPSASPLIIESITCKALLYFGSESLRFSASARAQASVPFDSS